MHFSVANTSVSIIIINITFVPMVWRNWIIYTVYYVGKITLIVFKAIITIHSVCVNCVLELSECPRWHGAHGCARVRGNHAFPIITNFKAKRFTVYLNVIKFDWPKQLVNHRVPFKSLYQKLLFVVIAKRQFRVVLDRVHWHVQGEHVLCKQFLFHHLVKERRGILFSHSRICKTNNAIKAACKHILRLDISKCELIDN